MKSTATQEAIPRRPKVECADCGASADLRFVEDTANSADGYRGDLALCRACWQAREAQR